MYKTEGVGGAPADRKQGNPNLNEVVRRLEERLQQLGPGPYPPEKQQVYEKLQALLQKTRSAQQQNAAAKQEPVVSDNTNDSQSDSQSTTGVMDIAGSPPPASNIQPAASAAAFVGGTVAFPSGFPAGVKYTVQYDHSASLPSVGYAIQPANNLQFQQVAIGGGSAEGAHYAQVTGGNLRFTTTVAAQAQQPNAAANTNASATSEYAQNGAPSWPQLTVPAFEARSFEQLIRETDAQLQLEDDLEDAFVQLADDFVEQAIEFAIRIAKHRGSSTIEAQDMLVALERYAAQPVTSLPQLGLAPASSKRRVDSEAHRQRLALINKKFKKF